MSESKSTFLKAYSNLPEDERNQIIVIIDGRSYTWNRAYDEIQQNTELGKKILIKLERLGIIWQRKITIR